MFKYILFLLFLTCIYAFQKNCNSCKYFIHHFDKNPEFGLCKFFKNTPYEDKNIVIYDFASHCRDNENLCGNDGLFYETNFDYDKNDKQDFINKYENLNNSCCGEVNEKSELEELEQLEKEFFEIYQKIRKHNTRQIFNTAKDIYKLFKKK